MSKRPARRAQPIVQSGWRNPLSEPIVLANGKRLETLLEAGKYVASLQDQQLSMGLNFAAAGLMHAAERPTPENIVEATNRVKAGLFFNRLLKREAS